MEMGFQAFNYSTALIDEKLYDAAVIGGGLAGLSLSIQLAKAGYNVVLFEKEKYPFHKVCGEYISLESWDFIKGLGLDLEKMNLPIIKNLIVSSPNGNSLEQPLPLGGFGISRYGLDNELYKIAKDAGVKIHEGTKVNELSLKGFTAYQALIGEYEKHKKLTRITWPVWFYVAVTGVVVYLMINPYYT